MTPERKVELRAYVRERCNPQPDHPSWQGRAATRDVMKACLQCGKYLLEALDAIADLHKEITRLKLKKIMTPLEAYLRRALVPGPCPRTSCRTERFRVHDGIICANGHESSLLPTIAELRE